MERYIAIDNVCAWPNLTLLPEGTIIATIFNQPTHGGWEGDVECWASEDEGRTWTLRGIPAPHEPGTNRMNVAAGLAHDGSLIVLASGWNRRLPAEERPALSFDKAESLSPWVCRSSDGGRTWERSELVETPEGGAEKITPFGDIVKLNEGTLGACLYGCSPPNPENNAYFYSSGDDGRTWKRRGTIRENNANETTPVVLPDGRLLAVARTLGDQHLELFASLDQGRSWQEQGALTLGFQHPGHLLLLQDSRLLLTYGLRNQGLHGVAVRISDDQGQTWTPPRILVILEGAPDSGYPSSVQAPDGTLVTAYYCSGVPSHQRYHMGVVRWLTDK